MKVDKIPFPLRNIIFLLRLLPPDFPGKTRFARFIQGHFLSLSDIRVEDKYGHQYIIPNLAEPIGFHLLIDGVYEHLLLDFLVRYLRPGSVVVDAGANIGTFTLPLSSVVGEKGKVISLEPSPEIFNYLEKNLKLNCIRNVDALNLAASNSTGVKPFYESPIDRYGMGSFIHQFHDNPIQVKTKTIDDILADTNVNTVDLLKVDVEGHEIMVFQGAEKLLTSNMPPLIVFEFCDWAEEGNTDGKIGGSQEYLRNLGYKIYKLENYLKNKEPIDKIIIRGTETLIAKREIDV